MEKKINRTASKALAIVITALLLLSTIQIGLFTVFAAGAFTITVKDDSATPAAIAGATVKLTKNAPGNDEVFNESTDDSGMVTLTNISNEIEADDTVAYNVTLSVEKDNFIYTSQTLVIDKNNYTGNFDVTMTSVFKAYSAANTNGKVTVNGTENPTVDAPVKANNGSNVSVVVTPNENFEIATLKIGSQDIITASDDSVDRTSYSDTFAISEETEIIATFRAIEYKIEITVSGDGDVTDGVTTITKDTVGGSVTVNKGDNKTLTITPNDANGYELGEIQMNGNKLTVGTDNDVYSLTELSGVYTLVIKTVNTDGVNLSVSFSLKQYSVTVTSYNNKGEVSTSQGSAFVDSDDSPCETNVSHGGDIIVTCKPVKTRTKSCQVSYFMVKIGDGEPVRYEATDNNQLTVSAVQGECTVDVYFTDMPITEDTWDNYIELEGTEITDGTINKGSSTSDIYLFTNSNIILKNKTTTPAYTKIDGFISGANDFWGFESNKVIDKSSKITCLQLRNKDDRRTEIQCRMDKDIVILVDKQAPTVDSAEIKSADAKSFVNDENTTYYSEGTFTIDGTVNDANETFDGIEFNSGISKVEFSVDGTNWNTATLANGEYSCALGNLTETTTVKIKATDNAGNESSVTEKTIIIDNTAPTLASGNDAIAFELKNSSEIAKVGNYLTFGLFFNEKLVATVKVTDDASGMGENNTEKNAKATMLLESNGLSYGKDNNGIYKSTEGGVSIYEFVFEKDALDEYKNLDASVTLPFTGTVKFKFADNVGNEFADYIYANTQNSNMADSETAGIIMLENDAPVVSEIQAGYMGTTLSACVNETIFNNNIALSLTAQDADSGLNSIDIKVNDVSLDGYPKDYTSEKNIAENSYSFDTENLTANLDGSYKIEVNAYDNAGNCTQQKLTVYKDTTCPMITDFSFNPENENGNNSSAPVVNATDYGFFFKQNVEVTIKAEDVKSDNEIASGVSTITVKLVDADNHKVYFVETNGGTIVEQSAGAEPKAVAVADNSIKFTVPANFKGQIYAYATDKVDNKGEFVSPSSAVVENTAKHTETSSIVIANNSSSAPVGTENTTFAYSGTASSADSEMDYDVTQNVPLYSTDAVFDLTVSDSYSGIKSISTKLYYKDNTGAEKMADFNPTWTDVSVDENVTTVKTAEVTIDAVTYNFNDMTLVVEFTDNAGNVSYDFVSFGIDTTAPVISLEYNNNDSDSTYSSFFKADRTATIRVAERNFDEELFKYSIANEHGVVPSLSEWKQVVTDENNLNNNTYEATISYQADGDYTFEMSATDRATNPNSEIVTEAVAPFTFTIDKTMPVILVVYDNMTSKTGTNFFDAQRTATITINEHNFDTSRILITGTASDDGTEIVFPSATAWATEGDVHTATITYSADAKYTFDIAFNDMAGNSSADYAMDEFYVDNTDPIVEITGVTNNQGNSFNGDVSPVITFFDKNFDSTKATFTITGVKNGRIEANSYTAVVSPDGNGTTNTYTLFNNKTGDMYNRDYDDIYSIKADITDLAGRTATATQSLSVNRFGSSYDIESLKEVSNLYFTQSQDVVFTETNVNDIANYVVTLFTADSVGKTLVLNDDYTIEKISGAGQWSVYRYTVLAKNFANDGKYTLTVYSDDAAGNKNDSTDTAKNTAIEFVVDKIPPIITSETLDTQNKENNKFNENTKEVVFSISDNHLVNAESVAITIDGEKVQYEIDDSGKYTVTVNESSRFQTISVSVKDAAGQESSLSAETLVTTSFFARWYNNKLAFFGSIGAVVLLGVVIIILAAKKGKKEDK